MASEIDIFVSDGNSNRCSRIRMFSHSEMDIFHLNVYIFYYLHLAIVKPISPWHIVDT